MGKQKKIILIILSVSIAICLFCIGLAFTCINKQWKQIEHIKIEATDIETNSYAQKEVSYHEEIQTGTRTIAIFGVDANNTKQLTQDTNSDVILIISIDNATKQARIVSVYRDTWLCMPNGNYNKANSAMLTSATNAMNMLNRNLDLQITDYIALNWAAIADAVNCLGGLDDIDVTEAMMKEINGYITNVAESTHIGTSHLEHGGVQTLDGVQVVAYCRLRHQDNDFLRTARQREVIAKILVKAKNANLATLYDLINIVTPNIAMTLDSEELITLAQSIHKFSIEKSTGFPFTKYTEEFVGDIKTNWPVLPVDLAYNVKELHKFLYDAQDYDPSSVVMNLSEEISKQSGIYANN